MIIIMDKRVRVGQDLISDLPVSIIESILMLLPIKDAIRTSILSTKWKFRWASIPRLVFNEESMVSSATEDAIDKDCLKKFVTRTLFRHEGPIHKFRLISSIESCPETHQWLLFLSRKDIKELILEIDADQYFFDVPPCLYSFRNLTFLELSGCEFGSPPAIFRGFLWLKSLILRDVVVPSDTIQTIAAHSPLLESLECIKTGQSKLRISAPNLKNFRLVCTHQQAFLCAPLLAKMSVSLDLDGNTDGEFEREPLVCNYTNFFGGIANLESLNGYGYFTRYLSVGIEYCQHPLVFNHLQIITLCGVDFQYKDEILVVVRLIVDASANLREFQLTIDPYEEDNSEIPNVHFWDSECPRNCTFRKLKVIKMSDFCGGIHEMKFIKFLLESSQVLETMNVEPSDYPAKKHIQNSVYELLSYCRASTNAKILFKKR